MAPGAHAVVVGVYFFVTSATYHCRSPLTGVPFFGAPVAFFFGGGTCRFCKNRHLPFAEIVPFCARHYTVIVFLRPFAVKKSGSNHIACHKNGYIVDSVVFLLYNNSSNLSSGLTLGAFVNNCRCLRRSVVARSENCGTRHTAYGLRTNLQKLSLPLIEARCRANVFVRGTEMFTVLDWIIVGVAVVAFVIGIIKGIFRQLFALGGILLVFKCGSLLTPYAQEWLSSLIPDDSVRSLVALLASYIVLFVVWALISGIILKILEKSKALGGINRIMGGVLGIAIVYVCCAVLFALVLKTSDTFMPWLKNIMKPLIEGENPSWIVTNIFPADGNKLGEWIVRSLLDKLNEMMPDTGSGTGEAASAVLSWLVSAAA